MWLDNLICHIVIEFLGCVRDHILVLAGAVNNYKIQLLQECHFIHLIINLYKGQYESNASSFIIFFSIKCGAGYRFLLYPLDKDTVQLH
jgi:hypothetical protein